jgi:hypothetical protein
LSGLKTLNLALAFILELGLLAAFAYGGWQTGDALWTKIVFALGAALLVAVVWSIFAAPASRRRLPQPWLALLKLVLFGAGALVLFVTGQPMLAVILFVFFLVNLGLAFVWQQH